MAEVEVDAFVQEQSALVDKKTVYQINIQTCHGRQAIFISFRETS